MKVRKNGDVMTEELHVEAWRLVGLPNPNQVRLDDSQLLEAYGEFCANMLIVEGGDLVVFEEPFGVDNLTVDFAAANTMAVELLSTFCDKETVRECMTRIASKLRELEEMELDDEDGEAGEAIGKEELLRLVEVSREFRATIDFARLGGVPHRHKQLGSIDTSAGLGLHWNQSYQIFDFNKGWAIVILYPDSDEEYRDSLPRIAGFCRLEHLSRGVVNYLSKYATPSPLEADERTINGFQDDLVRAWAKLSEFEDDWGDFFLQFDEDGLAFLRQEFGTLYSIDLKEAVIDICDQLNLERWRLVRSFGQPKDAQYLTPILRRM